MQQIKYDQFNKWAENGGQDKKRERQIENVK